jgi:hypothetical protein
MDAPGRGELEAVPERYIRRPGHDGGGASARAPVSKNLFGDCSRAA